MINEEIKCKQWTYKDQESLKELTDIWLMIHMIVKSLKCWQSNKNTFPAHAELEIIFKCINQQYPEWIFTFKGRNIYDKTKSRLL